jgi:hypothetical protein
MKERLHALNSRRLATVLPGHGCFTLVKHNCVPGFLRQADYNLTP